MASQLPAMRLPALGSLFAWLLDHGVTSERIATLLHTTSGNVRVCASRGRLQAEPPQIEPSLIAEPVSGRERALLGIRLHHDYVLPSRTSTQHLDSLTEDLSRIIETHRSEYRFGEGIDAVRQLLSRVGYAAGASRIALKARIHEHLSWFHCQRGESESAIRHGLQSVALWRVAYQETARRAYADDFSRSVLPVSNACLLAGRPMAARRLLEVARDASACAGKPLGSDHFRQRGVAAFQLGEEDDSRQCFLQAACAMHDLGEAATAATPLMASDRHICLLTPINCDRMMEVREAAKRCFGSGSLEFSMSNNWTAASLLSTDSPSLLSTAMEMLEDNAELASRFGHQQTVTTLLKIAPALGLYPKLRRSYVRRALYENTARNK